MTEKRYFKKEYEEQYFIFDSTTINEETISEFEEIDIRLFADSLTGDEVVNLLNELSKENQKLKKYNKGQELEIIRLHNLADAMSAVLRELGIYDVYNDEQIENVKRRVK